MVNVIEALPLKRRLLYGKSTALPFIAFQKEVKPATRGKKRQSLRPFIELRRGGPPPRQVPASLASGASGLGTLTSYHPIWLHISLTCAQIPTQWKPSQKIARNVPNLSKSGPFSSGGVRWKEILRLFCQNESILFFWERIVCFLMCPHTLTHGRKTRIGGKVGREMR